MNKHLIFIAGICLSLGLMAEPIPQGYYDHINGLSDSLLKSALHDSICGGTRYEYGANQYHSSSNPPEWMAGDLKAYGTWQALPVTDRREDGTIWDMYSNSVRYYPKRQGESGCSLNIEHCLPKSWWGWNSSDTRDTSLMAYKDLYNLNPSDAQANSNKSNYAPGHVKTGDKFDNGSFRMDSKNKSRYNYICFEPAPEYRGDFARAYFYMVTAYENLTWSSTYRQYVNNDHYRMFSDSIVKVLLDWHRADPVSDKELCRADRISSIQHNRNPFIDYPILVEYIWGNLRGQAVNLAQMTPTAVGVCPEYIPAEDTEHLYDTLINLPALTKKIINALPNGYASDKIQSNGTASITMGASATDGWIAFSSLALSDSATLVFRASIYNTASSMQLDIYAGSALVKSITQTATQNTRNEIIYRVTIPAGTDSITLKSVGGSTSQRACMQELYLLKRKPTAPSGVCNPQETTQQEARLVLINGVLYIKRDNQYYTLDGQKIR